MSSRVLFLRLARQTGVKVTQQQVQAFNLVARSLSCTGSKMVRIKNSIFYCFFYILEGAFACLAFPCITGLASSAARFLANAFLLTDYECQVAWN